ncbi:MAG TPA: fused MFS/spermidine synthase [Dehalococcoidia bacterium]|jgi:spermidine synthase|nr:fused MFS/spermidine synthase [Dehalococcoidia bacterium]
MSVPRSRDAVQTGVLDGRAALLIGGVVQSVLLEDGDAKPDGYWPWLLPERAPRRVLLLGLGGGTVVRLLQRRFPEQRIEVVSVEDDPAVLRLAHTWLADVMERLTILQAEAGAALKQLRARGERFDLVIVDLFQAGAVPPFVCRRRFLERVAAVIAAEGLLSINLNRGRGRSVQLRGLARRFTVERVVGVGMNLVVHARPR